MRVLFASLLLVACAPQASDGPLAEASRLYRNHDWAGARAAAAKSGNSAEAALIEGLSAMQEGDLAGAEAPLKRAAASPDAELSGRAFVSLGSMYEREGNAAKATDAFEQAAARLKGSERERALRYASRAKAAAGGSAPASAGVGSATGSAPARASSQGEQSRTPTSAAASYTIKAGAFRSKDRARVRAKELQSEATKAGLGAPTVSPVHTAQGELLWGVSLGRFANKAAAEQALSRMGRSDLLVARLSDDDGA